MPKNKQEILEVAINLAEQDGYTMITRDQIALSANVAQGTVTNHLGSMKQMRKKLVRHCVRTDNLIIIAQALVAKDEYAVKHATTKQKLKALTSVI